LNRDSLIRDFVTSLLGHSVTPSLRYFPTNLSRPYMTCAYGCNEFLI